MKNFGDTMKQLSLLLVLIAATLSTPGCGSDDTTNLTPAPTPKQIIKRAYTAMLNGDEDVYLACHIATPKQRKALIARMETSQAMVSYRNEFTQEYGADIWKKLKDSENKRSANYNFKDYRKYIEDIDALEITIDGDVAAFPWSDNKPLGKLRKIDGAWLIDAASVLPTEDVVTSYTITMRKTREVIDKFRKVIGNEKLLPEDIDAELARELFEGAVGVKIPDKPKFNIDNLP